MGVVFDGFSRLCGQPLDSLLCPTSAFSPSALSQFRPFPISSSCGPPPSASAHCPRVWLGQCGRSFRGEGLQFFNVVLLSTVCFRLAPPVAGDVAISLCYCSFKEDFSPPLTSPPPPPDRCGGVAFASALGLFRAPFGHASCSLTPVFSPLRSFVASLGRYEGLGLEYEGVSFSIDVLVRGTGVCLP